MRTPSLANCDNFQHSLVKIKTMSNLPDVAFTEVLLRGRVFKTSGNIPTVMVTASQAE